MDRPLTSKQRWRSALVALTFVAMIAYLIAMTVNPSAAVLQCPFHWLTGYSCPGCGMTRSTAAVLAGDLGAAVRFHPLGPPFVVIYAIVAVHHAVQVVRGRVWTHALTRAWERFGRALSVIALLAVVGFGGVRLVLELTGILTPL